MKDPVVERTCSPRLSAGSHANYAPPFHDPSSRGPLSSVGPPSINGNEDSCPLPFQSLEPATLPGSISRVSLEIAEFPQWSSQPHRSRPSFFEAADGHTARTTTVASLSLALSSDKGYKQPSLSQLKPPFLQKKPATVSGHTSGRLQSTPHRKFRQSVDAASAAQYLATCSPHMPAVAAPEQPVLAFQDRSKLHSSSRGSAAPCGDDWSFGDNLQHARVLARYAALEAAEELRYEPYDSSGEDSEGCGTGGAHRPLSRTRSAWKLFSAMLGSVSASGRVQRWNGSRRSSIVSRRSEASSRSSVGGWASESGAAEDESVTKVVRSRDSRRLLRSHRSRVGIDGGNDVEASRHGPFSSSSPSPAAAAVRTACQQRRFLDEGLEVDMMAFVCAGPAR